MQLFVDLALFESAAKPGDLMQTIDKEGEVVGFIISCPGCGKNGVLTLTNSPMQIPGKMWSMTGYPDAISLTPSIKSHCCGWHGFLKNGKYET